MYPSSPPAVFNLFNVHSDICCGFNTVLATMLSEALINTSRLTPRLKRFSVGLKDALAPDQMTRETLAELSKGGNFELIRLGNLFNLAARGDFAEELLIALDDTEKLPTPLAAFAEQLNNELFYYRKKATYLEHTPTGTG